MREAEQTQLHRLSAMPPPCGGGRLQSIPAQELLHVQDRAREESLWVCGARSYCSAECVLVDWPRHKKECKGLSEDGWMDKIAGIRAKLVAREGGSGSGWSGRAQ